MVQLDQSEELQRSISQTAGEKVHGRYKRLSPFLDKEGIWRVGLRIREYAPFTANRKPPAFIPNNSRLTTLLMTQAHVQKHSGVDETVAPFRMNGYWMTEAAKLAKTIKSKCVVCRYLNKLPIKQRMGGIPQEQMISPMAWGEIELDLFGPIFD